MVPFNVFNAHLQAHVKNMTKDITTLFVVALDKDEMWATYLSSFPAGTNPMFRTRTEFDCSCCRHFVKGFGNVVSIGDDDTITTIWDFDAHDADFQVVVDALAKYVKNKRIENVFVTKELTFGIAKSFEKDKTTGEVIQWDHFNAQIDSKFRYSGSDAIGEVLSNYNAIRSVFERSLKELTSDSVSTTLDLIAQKSFYKGEEWKWALEKFLQMQKVYAKSKHKDAFCWAKSIEVGPVVGKIRNTSVGTFLIDLSEGMDLDVALTRYEKTTAPDNYKRPKEVFSKKMIADAEKQLTDEGLIDSLARRHATLDDITVNNILFADRNVTRKLANTSVFDELRDEQGINPKSLSRSEEIGIEDFIKDVLPTATSLEAYFDNDLKANLVSLIAPQNIGSKSLFKWDNGFSWAYAGNVTDSLKERVKAAGGTVNGELRFSIQWNEKGDNNIDFDAHCREPNKNHIYFSNRMPNVHQSSGRLDVDVRVPGNKIAVENITWTDRKKMQEGTYIFYVNKYAGHTSRGGFTAEIEFDGQIHQFEYPYNLKGDQNVVVAEVEYRKATGFKIIPKLASSLSSKKVWGLQTLQFHPVQVCMYSPNYWDDQKGIGHRHYFFMLKNAVNEDSPNGFFNEYLREEFMKHKRVFAALGSKMRVEPVDDQLSGLGFSATKHNKLTVKVGGRVNRTLTISF